MIAVHQQSDLDAVYAGLSRAWNEIRYRTLLIDELRNLERQHKKYFDTETGPDGSKWPPLKDRTVIRKGHEKILVDTGALRRSLVSTHSSGVRIVIDEPAGRTLSFGTDVEYSVFHDTAKGNRPARRHVGVKPEYVNGFGERVIDFALEELKQ